MSMRCKPADVMSARLEIKANTDLLLIRSADGKSFYATGDDAGILMFLTKHSSHKPDEAGLVNRVLVCEWAYYDLADVIRCILSSGLSFSVVQSAYLHPIPEPEPEPITDSELPEKTLVEASAL